MDDGNRNSTGLQESFFKRTDKKRRGRKAFSKGSDKNPSSKNLSVCTVYQVQLHEYFFKRSFCMPELLHCTRLRGSYITKRHELFEEYLSFPEKEAIGPY